MREHSSLRPVPGLATNRSLSMVAPPPLCVFVCPTDRTLQVLTDLVQSARSRTLGILHPSFSIVRFFHESLHRHLPANVHQLISGRMCISLTRVSDWQNVLVSDFQSKDEVVDVSRACLGAGK